MTLTYLKSPGQLSCRLYRFGIIKCFLMTRFKLNILVGKVGGDVYFHEKAQCFPLSVRPGWIIWSRHGLADLSTKILLEAQKC